MTSDGGNNVACVGGIIGGTGLTKNGEINMIANCYNLGKLNCKSELQTEVYTGGIVAASTDNSIINCYNTGDIKGNAPKLCISGVVGRVEGSTDTVISNVINLGTITIESEDYYHCGGITALNAKGENYTDISNAYNLGTMNIKKLKENSTGGISSDNWYNTLRYTNCAYLAGICEKGVGYGGNSLGITEYQNISDFPSVLEIVNGDNAFKADTNNKNNGYPILEWE